MLAREADALKEGDKVLTFNGIYTQYGNVLEVQKDHRGVRWIYYSWKSPDGKLHTHGRKRHNSVYLP